MQTPCILNPIRHPSAPCNRAGHAPSCVAETSRVSTSKPHQLPLRRDCSVGRGLAWQLCQECQEVADTNDQCHSPFYCTFRKNQHSMLAIPKLHSNVCWVLAAHWVVPLGWTYYPTWDATIQKSNGLSFKDFKGFYRILKEFIIQHGKEKLHADKPRKTNHEAVQARNRKNGAKRESTGRQAAENEPRSTYNHETAGTELKEKV